MNLNSKSTLAKLLARENIIVQHGNYPTAFFDVSSRVLGLPLWKDRGSDVYDLLVGHEVGHSVYTPPDGWHNASSVDDLPKDYLNVIEDIRIEKLIQRQYPGLIGSFKRGYKVLDNDNFFGIRHKNVDSMHFMNRLNLKSKLRDLIDVNFSEEEQPYVDMAMAVETWDDVISVTRKLYEYMKKLQKENRVLPSDVKNDSKSKKDSNQSYSKSSDSLNDKNSRDSQRDDGDDGDDGDYDDYDDDEDESYNNGQDSSDDSSDDSSSCANTDTVSSDINQIDTDRSYRNNEDKLLDVDEAGRQPLIVRGLSDKQIEKIIVSFDEIKASRKEAQEEFECSPWWEETSVMYSVDQAGLAEKYNEFMTETNKFVNVMAKEFEMRKAAFQYSRSQSSRSGSLDLSKLYNYKFSDDIFRRVTRLANTKNHGMIMLVDYSSSMANVMTQVIKQIITLAMFCKKVNIPFDVYGFTTTSDYREISYNTNNFQLGDLMHDTIMITHQISSTFNKNDYALAIRQMFYLTERHDNRRTVLLRHHEFAKCDALGGTPLNEVLTAMPHIIEKFKARHNVEKTILTILTDGDAQRMNIAMARETKQHTRTVAVQLKTGVVKTNTEFELTTSLINHIRKKCGVVTIGYFLADSRYSFNGAIGRATGSWTRESFIVARREMATQKFVSYDNKMGYDKYFVIDSRDRNLDTDNDEFEVADNAKVSDIRRAFKKFATSKKLNRVLATQFAEAIS